MKNKKALINISSSILVQVFIALSGFILPHFFILIYGSSINGMVSSTTQFLSYLALVESGISAASIVELYKPLSNNDIKKRDYILSATKKFYMESGIVYLVLLFALICFYPIFIKNQVDQTTTRIMILILASSNLVDYYVLGKYRVLLMADQKLYVINNIQSIGVLINLVISLFFIYLKANVLLVKFIATLVYIFRSLILIIYIKKKYGKINFGMKTYKNALPQRWNALFHQIVAVICNNTDIVLITLCLGSKSLLEVSVYYVYSLVGNAIANLFASFSNGILPSFGQLYSLNRNNEISKAYSLFEYAFEIIIFTAYGCMYLLIIPFVSLYTRGSADVNYVRPTLATLFVVMGLIRDIRTPSVTMIQAAGHYKQTQYRALLEALINIVISLILIFKFGIIGTIIGTICSYLYRTSDCIIYTSKYLVNMDIKKIIFRITRNFLITFLGCLLLNEVKIITKTWISFFTNGLISSLILFSILIISNYLCEPYEMKEIFERIKKIKWKLKV